MKDFVFSNTTKVYFGKDQLHHLSEEIAQFGKGDRESHQSSQAECP